MICNLRHLYPFKKLHSIYYNVKYGIKNLYHYLPVIWRNREWDEYYIYALLAKKFERMEYLHSNHGHLVRSLRKAKQLMIAKNLAKRLVEQNYLDNALINDSDNEVDFTFEKIEDSEFVRMIDNRTQKQKDAFNRARKRAQAMEKQDREMLVKLMGKYLMEWWD